jgi:hypothetical protein
MEAEMKTPNFLSRAAIVLAAAGVLGLACRGAEAQAPPVEGTNTKPPAYSPRKIDVMPRQAWGGYPYSAYLDAEVADPDVHRMLYEDENVRLLEVSNPPGLDVNMHGHPFPSVFVRDSGGSGGNAVVPEARTALEITAGAGAGGLFDPVLDPNSPFNGQGWQVGPPPAGWKFPSCTTSPPQAPHKPINRGSVPLHFYRVEFPHLDAEEIRSRWKALYPWMLEPKKPVKELVPGPALGPNFSEQWPYPVAYDEIAAAPNNYRQLFNDGHLRLIEVTVRPGETTPMAGTPYPSVSAFYAISGNPQDVTDIKLDPKSPLNGQGAGYGPPPTVMDMKVPSCMTMAPQAPHAIHNGGTAPLHYYRVEFIRVDGDDFPTRWQQWYPWMKYMKNMR